MNEKERGVFSTTNLTKLIAEYFYAVILYDYEKRKVLIPDELLEQYASGGKFDIDKLINDTKNGNFKKDYYVLLLPADLLKADTGTMKEIEKAHENIRKESLKGGYIRAVLEVLYDRRFQEEFNRKTDDFLKAARDKKENKPFSSILLPLFLDTASRQDNRGVLSWDYSSVIAKKQIGKKEKGKSVEMVDNPYSAYKVFGQGEYSKLLIGYRSNPSLGFNEMRAKGFETILTDEKVCMQENKDKSLSPIIPYEGVTKNFKLTPGLYLDGVAKKFEFNSRLYLLNKDYYTMWKRRFLILDLQMDAIMEVLQGFNNYVPYELNEELEVKLNKLCKFYYCKYIKTTDHLDRLDEYEDENRYTPDECRNIKKTFNSYYYSYFNSPKDTSEEDAVSTIEGKIRWLLEQKESSLIGSSIRTDLKGKVWTRILNKFQEGYALSGDSPANDEESNKNTIFPCVKDEHEETCLSEAANCLLDFIDKEFHKAPRFFSSSYELIKKIDSNTSGLYLWEKTGKKSRMTALKDSMHVLLSGDKAKRAFDAYLDEKEKSCPGTNIPWKELNQFLPKPKNGDSEYNISRLKMLYAINAVFDRKHSWSGAFTRYKKRELNAYSDEKKEEKVFREKMQAVESAFREWMGC